MLLLYAGSLTHPWTCCWRLVDIWTAVTAGDAEAKYLEVGGVAL